VESSICRPVNGVICELVKCLFICTVYTAVRLGGLFHIKALLPTIGHRFNTAVITYLEMSAD
jgi:hypothetical protein